MPDTRESLQEKTRVWEAIEEVIGKKLQPARPARPDWRTTSDQQLCVFVTFSNDEKLFFDVKEEDLQQWLEYPQSFIVFVIGEHTNTIVIPVPVMAKQLTSNCETRDQGNFKLHLRPRRLEFHELPGFDLTPFWDGYSQLAVD